MLDLKKIELESEAVKANLAKRGFDISIIDQVLEINSKRKDLIHSVDSIRSQLNTAAKEIGQLKKAGQSADEKMAEVSALKTKMGSSEEDLKRIDEKLHHLMAGIPNLVSDDIPIGKDDSDNKELKKWGEARSFSFKPKDHATLGENLGMLDFEVAAKLTGSRFVVYKKLLARLERALANFMIDFHLKKNYEEIIPPYIVNEETLFGTGNLPKFEQDLFKLMKHEDQGRQWYLIPTAEVPVTNLLTNSISQPEELPKRYVAYTPCFRSEAGSYGKDTKGLIRMHQFNKVEMVCITTEDDSERAHQEMLDSGCKILEELKLPYRVVQLCSGDIGFGSRKTFDLEVWLPSQDKYREISSISNCWDFQARRAKMRYKKDGKTLFVHTLNGSGLAVGRTLVAILENYQNEDGSIDLPEVIWPYMGGIKRISKA